MTIPKKTAIIVLGMHRSGSSYVASLINSMGFSVGKSIMPPQPDNPKGFFENMRIFRINEKIITNLNSTYYDFSPIEDGIDSLNIENTYTHEIEKVLYEEFDMNDNILVKDPLLCLTLPLWKSSFEKLAHDIKYIVTLRHPKEVAESLNKREGFSLNQSLLLWIKYYIYILSNKPKDTKYLYINFSKSKDQALKQIEDFLDIRISTIEDTYDEDLKHSTYEDIKHNGNEILEFAMDLYKILDTKPNSIEIS